MDPAVDLLPSPFAKGHHSGRGFVVAAIEKIGDPDAAARLQALIPTALQPHPDVTDGEKAFGANTAGFPDPSAGASQTSYPEPPLCGTAYITV